MSATMVDKATQNFKSTLAKTPKNSLEKMKFGFGPENKLFATSIWSLFFNFRCFSRKSQSQQKLERKSLILQYRFAQTSTHSTFSKIYSQNTAKNFPAKVFRLVSKRISSTPLLDAQ